MKLNAIKTRKILPPKDDLWQILNQSIPQLAENSVVVITSKIISICEGRVVKISDQVLKDELIKEESELYLERGFYPLVMHTITLNHLAPAAGIDESNGDGYYILYPKEPDKSARQIWQFLRSKFKLQNLGVIITDSCSVPLRRGIVGISIAHFGFKPLKDYRGSRDIFGREIQISQANITDSLAAAAVLEMGEGNEQSPIVLITDLKDIEFGENLPVSDQPYSSFLVPLDEDIFSPFFKSAPWKKGGRK